MIKDINNVTEAKVDELTKLQKVEVTGGLYVTSGQGRGRNFWSAPVFFHMSVTVHLNLSIYPLIFK